MLTFRKFGVGFMWSFWTIRFALQARFCCGGAKIAVDRPYSRRNQSGLPAQTEFKIDLRFLVAIELAGHHETWIRSQGPYFDVGGELGTG